MKKLLFTTAIAFMLASPAMAAGEDRMMGTQGSQMGTQTQQGAQLSSETVREIQQALNDQGFDPGQIDGIWGQNTASALQDYQRSAGLEPTGQPNTNTLQQLGVSTAGVSGQQQGGTMGGTTGSGTMGGGTMGGGTMGGGGTTGGGTMGGGGTGGGTGGGM